MTCVAPGVHVEPVIRDGLPTGTYRGRVYDPRTQDWVKKDGDDPGSKSFPTWTQAEGWAIERQKRHYGLAEAVGVPIKQVNRGRRTFAKIAWQWHAELEGEQCSRATRASHIRQWITAFGEDTPFDEVTPAMVRETLFLLRDGGPGQRKLKQFTRATRLAILRRIIVFALRDGEITADPTLNIDKIVVPRTRYPARILTDDELFAITPHMPAHLGEAAVLLAYDSGLRISEVAALPREWVRLHAIDEDRPAAVFVQDVIDRDGTVRHSPKGKISLWVPLTPRTVRALEAHYAAYPSLPYEGAPVFRAADGGDLTAAAIRYAWDRAQEKAGLEGRHARFQDLRHCAATNMILAEVPIDVVKKVMRHQNIATTNWYLEHATLAAAAQWVTYTAEGGQAPRNRRHTA